MGVYITKELRDNEYKLTRDMNKFESRNKNESSDKNPFENKENVVNETVKFIMDAKVDNGDSEEGWTEEAGRIIARRKSGNLSRNNALKPLLRTNLNKAENMNRCKRTKKIAYFGLNVTSLA